jgi:hypothetical protein
MKKILPLVVLCLTSCSADNLTSYSLKCDGIFTNISETGVVIQTTKEKRVYEIDHNQMGQRNCVRNDLVLNCYKEVEYPNLERTKEHFVYNMKDFSLSDGIVRIGVDKITGKPIFLRTEIFRATCPMTVHKKTYH